MAICALANESQTFFLSFSSSLDFCPENQDKLCLLIDYSTATTQTQPSFATQKSVLNILQNHYPERLGKAIVCNVPVSYFESEFIRNTIADLPFLICSGSCLLFSQ